MNNGKFSIVDQTPLVLTQRSLDQKGVARKLLMVDEIPAGVNATYTPGGQAYFDELCRFNANKRRESNTVEYWEKTISLIPRENINARRIATNVLNRKIRKGVLAEAELIECDRKFEAHLRESESRTARVLPGIGLDPEVIAKNEVDIPEITVPPLSFTVRPIWVDGEYGQLRRLEDAEVVRFIDRCTPSKNRINRRLHDWPNIDDINNAMILIEKRGLVAASMVCHPDMYKETFAKWDEFNAADTNTQDSMMGNYSTANVYCSEVVHPRKIHILASGEYVGSMCIFSPPILEGDIISETIGLMVLNDYGIASITWSG